MTSSTGMLQFSKKNIPDPESGYTLDDNARALIIDPFNGQEDIAHKIIRHTSENVFTEDPLRVYRAIQLAARFDFRIAPETMDLMRQVDIKELQSDRIYEELRKLLLLSPRPLWVWRR